MEILDHILAPSEITWPPSYNLRLSKKAKYVHFKILPHSGLEVVVPFRQHKKIVVENLLEEKKSWILKHLAYVKIPNLEHIKTLNLQAIDQIYHVQYERTNSSRLRHKIFSSSNGNTIFLYGDVENIPLTHLWLKKWLKQMAIDYLIPWLYDLSLQHNLTIKKASIRAQTTLWGSCTRQKHISLNYKLLFLPMQYAQHILLHELCHTAHLNHSKGFWKLLQHLDPNCMHNDNAIKDSEQYIPFGL